MISKNHLRFYFIFFPFEVMYHVSNKVVKLHITLRNFNKQIKIATLPSVDAFKEIGPILFCDLTKLTCTGF